MRTLILLSIVCLGLATTGCTVLRDPCEPDCPPPVCASCKHCHPGDQPCFVENKCCESSTLPYPVPQNCLIEKPCLSVAANIETQLLVAATSIEDSLNILAAAQKAENMPILNTAALTTPEGGMAGIVDMDWTGPVGPLVEKIAHMTHYRVKFLGNEPAIPILVTITAKRGIIAEILQNASFQAGKRATILVFPENHVIEVRYLS